jgi:hypothetical protein
MSRRELYQRGNCKESVKVQHSGYVGCIALPGRCKQHFLDATRSQRPQGSLQIASLVTSLLPEESAYARVASVKVYHNRKHADSLGQKGETERRVLARQRVLFGDYECAAGTLADAAATRPVVPCGACGTDK